MAINAYAGDLDIIVALAAVLFILSLFYAYRLRLGTQSDKPRRIDKARRRGYLLIGLWVILPPIWFFFELQFLHTNLMSSPNELSRVAHAQHLGRNIWLTIVVVLAAIVGIKRSPGP